MHCFGSRRWPFVRATIAGKRHLNRGNRSMRYSYRTLLTFVLAASAGADGQPPNKPTAEEVGDGRILLFDDKTLSGWRIDGDYEIVDGTLILGGTRKTRAYLPVPVVRNCEIRFQYRT